MNDAQIKHMVDRFLSWKLPDNFSPDAGVSFDPPVAWPWTTGTNLLDATQAEVMVRHMVAGLPADEISEPNKAVRGQLASDEVTNEIAPWGRPGLFSGRSTDSGNG